jgi:glycosyltransferase involved in cell wall biosynthesis
MPRVAILASDTGLGGAEISLARLAPFLRAGNWEPVYWVPGEGALTEELSRRGLAWRLTRQALFRSTSRYLGRAKIPDPAALLYDLQLLPRAAEALAHALRAEAVDLLHTNSIFSHLVGGLAARRLRLPCVWHVQDIVGPWSGAGLFRPVLRMGATALARRVICISQAVAAQFAGGPAARRVRVIYHGIDPDEFSPAGPRPFHAAWSADGRTVVGQVARLTPWKGQELLLTVAARARAAGLPLRFVFVGDDDLGLHGYGARLRARAAELNLDGMVTWAGWLRDIPGVMRSLDVLVHPAMAPEPFGLVVAEAMAAARPVVVANHGGAAEVAGPAGTARLFPPGDADACFEALRWVVDHPAEARAMGARARQRIESDFSLASFARQVLGVYAEAMKGEPDAA